MRLAGGAGNPLLLSVAENYWGGPNENASLSYPSGQGKPPRVFFFKKKMPDWNEYFLTPSSPLVDVSFANALLTKLRV